MKIKPEHLGPLATQRQARLMEKLLRELGIDLDNIKRADDIPDAVWEQCLDAIGKRSYKWGGSRPGAGPKPRPPRINHNTLTMYTGHLTREQKDRLMLTIQEFWLDPQTRRPLWLD